MTKDQHNNENINRPNKTRTKSKFVRLLNQMVVYIIHNNEFMKSAQQNSNQIRILLKSNGIHHKTETGLVTSQHRKNYVN